MTPHPSPFADDGRERASVAKAPTFRLAEPTRGRQLVARVRVLVTLAACITALIGTFLPTAAAAEGETGTVVAAVAEPQGQNYVTHFCPAPAVPGARTLSCSDGNPSLIQFNSGGLSAPTQISLPPGTYTAALSPLDFGAELGPLGFVNVTAGETTNCTFTLAGGPVCDGVFLPVADVIAPTVTINAPASGAVYPAGSRVRAFYGCEDFGGSRVSQCSGTAPTGSDVDTSSPGQKVFRVQASDGAGNTVVVEHLYTVTEGPALQVTPNSGLYDGQSVTVTGTNFSASTIFYLNQGLAAGDLWAIDTSTTVRPVGNPDGTVTTSTSVKRYITVNGSTYDCAQPGMCNLRVVDINAQPWQEAKAPIQFADRTVDQVTADVGSGGTATTRLPGGQTAADPLGTTIVSPVAGTVAIDETGATSSAPGFAFFGKTVHIEAPAATAANPLHLTFDIDSSLVPAGEDEQSIQVFRDGTPIQACSGPAATAAPDPCVTSRARATDGDVSITVLSSHASTWNLGTVTDKDAPSIAVASPVEGATFVLRQPVTAHFTCTDPGGSGVTSCQGTVPDGAALDTSSVGPKTFTVNARDAAGNTSSLQRTYRVVYDFTGFVAPVDNLPALNSMKAGAAVPVKFALAGNQGLAVFAAGSPTSGPVACSSSAPVETVEQTVTAGSSSLTYDTTTGRYSYVWKTNKEWAGTCRTLTVTLADGTQHRALFRFTR